MVQGLAQQSGGKFILRSMKGSGTTAEIWMRVAADEAGNVREAAGEPEDEADTTVEPLVILAVDDDPLVLDNTAAMLMELGHQVLQAQSGPEALKILDRRRVDLIITDYALPGMTGEELTQHIIASQPALSVLMVSGFASLPDGAGAGAKAGKAFQGARACPGHFRGDRLQEGSLNSSLLPRFAARATRGGAKRPAT